MWQVLRAHAPARWNVAFGKMLQPRAQSTCEVLCLLLNKFKILARKPPAPCPLRWPFIKIESNRRRPSVSDPAPSNNPNSAALTFRHQPLPMLRMAALLPSVVRRRHPCTGARFPFVFATEVGLRMHTVEPPPQHEAEMLTWFHEEDEGIASVFPKRSFSLRT